MKVMLEPAAPDHWKFRKLAELLYGRSKVSRACALAAAFGHASALWCRVMALAEDGRLVNWRADDLAQKCLWGGDSRRFIQSLIKVKLLEKDADGTFIVHDWHDHQGDVIEDRKKERDRKRKQREAKRMQEEKEREEREAAARGENGQKALELRPGPGASPVQLRQTPGLDPAPTRPGPGLNPADAGAEPQKKESNPASQGLTHSVPRDGRGSPSVPFPPLPGPSHPSPSEDKKRDQISSSPSPKKPEIDYPKIELLTSTLPKRVQTSILEFVGHVANGGATQERAEADVRRLANLFQSITAGPVPAEEIFETSVARAIKYRAKTTDYVATTITNAIEKGRR